MLHFELGICIGLDNKCDFVAGLVLGDSGGANVDSIRQSFDSIRFIVVMSVGHLLIRRCTLKYTRGFRKNSALCS